MTKLPGIPLLLGLALAAPASAAPETRLAECKLLYSKFVATPVREAKAALRDYSPGEKKAFAQFLAHTLRGPIPNLAEKSTSSFARRSSGTMADMLKSAGEFLLPVNLPLKAKNEVQEIFWKQWSDPYFVPTPKQKYLLKKNKVLDLFEGRGKFLVRHPYAPVARDYGRYTKNAIYYLTAAAALYETDQMGRNTLDRKEFLERPSEDESGKPVVQVLVETTPFPHTAIRIGHKVYSYGQEFMTSKPVGEYLGQDFSAGEVLSQSADLLKGVGDKAGVRAVRVVNLNLSAEETGALQRDLEMNTGKVYANSTMVNDCSTMVKRALEKHTGIKIPLVIDPFPSITSAYLGLRRALGDDRIGATEMVVPKSGDKSQFTLVRNAYLSMLEGRVLITSLPFNLAERARVDLTKSDGDLQYYIPEVQQEIDRWKEEARKKTEAELRELVPQGFKPGPERAERIAAARRLVQSVSDSMVKEADETIEFNGSEMKDVIKATEMRAAALKLREELFTRLQE